MVGTAALRTTRAALCLVGLLLASTSNVAGGFARNDLEGGEGHANPTTSGSQWPATKQPVTKLDINVVWINRDVDTNRRAAMERQLKGAHVTDAERVTAFEVKPGASVCTCQ